MRSYYQHLELGRVAVNRCLSCSSTCWPAIPASILLLGQLHPSPATGQHWTAPGADSRPEASVHAAGFAHEMFFVIRLMWTRP
jgi:hypothetical protein